MTIELTETTQNRTSDFDSTACNAIQILDLQQALQQITPVNCELSRILQNLTPSKDSQIIQVDYAFGDLIIDNGTLQLPINHQLCPIHHVSVPTYLKQALTYCPIPLFLTIDKTCEVFIRGNDRTIPLNTFAAGNFLGLFEIIDYLFDQYNAPKWSVAAGTRSIIMLPKISDTSKLRKLGEYIDDPACLLQLNTYEQHWELLKKIVNHNHFKEDWKCRVFFFNSAWLKPFETISAYEFKDFLTHHAWRQAQFSLRNVENSYLREMLAESMAMRRLKPDPYLVNQIEHLINIILQRAPGFKLATDQNAAPIASIQSAFTNIYEIKHHIPSIMHLASLDSLATDPHPIYYSLAHPTMLDGSPLSARSTTRKTNLKHIIYILNLPKNFIADGADNRLKTVKLRYFHTEGDPANQIDSSRVIPE